MTFLGWVWENWSRLWAAIHASEDALAKWKALLADHATKEAEIDPASPTAADETAALNKQSYEAAEEIVRQYAPKDYVPPQQDDGA